MPRPVPSANDRHVNGRDRVSRAMYRKLRDGWAYALGMLGRHVPKVGEGYRPKRRVTVVRVMGPRQREFDVLNMAGGLKPIIDAMLPTRMVGKHHVMGASMLVDDSPAWVDIVMVQERGPVAGCRITIEDV